MQRTLIASLSADVEAMSHAVTALATPGEALRG
jgi:hypothetical protein